MKLQANGVRTVIMHALMHTQGVIARPWRPDLMLGAARMASGGLAVWMSAKKPWRGVLEFDIPRHREFMGFRRDWPRMNTLPEWFTVESQGRYAVALEGGLALESSGRRARDRTGHQGNHQPLPKPGRRLHHTGDQGRLPRLVVLRQTVGQRAAAEDHGRGHARGNDA